MSETTPAQPVAPAPGQGAMMVNLQYVKDLSFEVPGAPQIFTQLRAQPQVGINLDVQARRLQDDAPAFEVALVIRAEATESGTPANGQTAPATVFVAELTYAGVFTLQQVPDDRLDLVLLVECPRLLFPFARNILADATREGGFPPVLLQPIDFMALYHARQQQQAQGAAPAGTTLT